jgi:hypothetical protein
MTSNPKVQNRQRSSANFLAIWVREILGRVSAAESLHKPSVNSETV